MRRKEISQTWNDFTSFEIFGKIYYFSSPAKVLDKTVELLVLRRFITPTSGIFPFYNGNKKYPILDIKIIQGKSNGLSINMSKEYMGIHYLSGGNGKEVLNIADFLANYFAPNSGFKINYLGNSLVEYARYYEDKKTYPEKEKEFVDIIKKYKSSNNEKVLNEKNVRSKLETNMRKTGYDLEELVDMILDEPGSRPQFIKLSNSQNISMMYEFLKSRDNSLSIADRSPLKNNSLKPIARKEGVLIFGKYYKTGGSYKNKMKQDINILFNELDNLSEDLDYYFVAAFDNPKEYQIFMAYSKTKEFPCNFHFIHFDDFVKI